MAYFTGFTCIYLRCIYIYIYIYIYILYLSRVSFEVQNIDSFCMVNSCYPKLLHHNLKTIVSSFAKTTVQLTFIEKNSLANCV